MFSSGPSRARDLARIGASSLAAVPVAFFVLMMKSEVGRFSRESSSECFA